MKKRLSNSKIHKKIISPHASLLLGSGGFKGHNDYLRKQINAFLRSNVKKVAMIFYALDPADRLSAYSWFENNNIFSGRKLESIHESRNQQEVLKTAEVIYVNGGNTFKLLHQLYKNNLIKIIQERVAAGIPYIGISAGSNIAAPTIRTTNDWPIVTPKKLDALSLLPFQINPHYFGGRTYRRLGKRLIEHLGETREQRIKEYHQETDNNLDVIGIPEGSVLIIKKNHISYESPLNEPAVIFRKGQKREEVTPNKNITHKLL